MQVLLIMNLIPDESKYYILQPDASDLKYLDNIQGLTRNEDRFTLGQEDDFDRIYDYISEKFYPTSERPEQPKYFGKWVQYEVDVGQLNRSDTPFYRVYVMEFLL